MCLKTHRLRNGFLIRLDKGEEVILSLTDFCAKERIGFASLSGIGAAQEVVLSAFDTKNKKYEERSFSGEIELVSLIGNAAIADGAPKIHIHACIADHSLNAYGGHLVSAKISATCEIVMANVSDVTITRKMNDAVGLMLID